MLEHLFSNGSLVEELTGTAFTGTAKGYRVVVHMRGEMRSPITFMGGTMAPEPIDLSQAHATISVDGGETQNLPLANYEILIHVHRNVTDRVRRQRQQLYVPAGFDHSLIWWDGCHVGAQRTLKRSHSVPVVVREAVPQRECRQPCGCASPARAPHGGAAGTVTRGCRARWDRHRPVDDVVAVGPCNRPVASRETAALVAHAPAQCGCAPGWCASARPTESGTTGVVTAESHASAPSALSEDSATVTSVFTASQAIRRAVSGWIGPAPWSIAASASAPLRSAGARTVTVRWGRCPCTSGSAAERSCEAAWSTSASARRCDALRVSPGRGISVIASSQGLDQGAAFGVELPLREPLTAIG